MAADRRSACLEFAQRHLTERPLSIEVASADASFRSYWRVRSGRHAWIVMDAPPAQEDVRPWLDVGARLREAGLHAPEVIAADVDDGLVLMEDLGTSPYLGGLSDATADALYGDALAALLRMQREVAADGLPVFDATCTIPEMELLGPWFLDRHLGFAAHGGDRNIIEDALQRIAAAADEQPRRFMHRDYHSRNLLIVDSPGANDAAPALANPGIIDFQGAMLGPVAYDLASLLRDCYIDWPPERIDAWVDGHRRRLTATGIVDVDARRFRRWFDLIGLQRHVKVLGLFCRLCYRDAKPGYLGDLPRVLGYVYAVARDYPELAAFADLLERAVGERDIRRPRGATEAANA